MKTNAIAAEPQSSWHQWSLVLLTVGTLGFGFRGYWLYEGARGDVHSSDLASIVYHTCQLLIAHGVHLEGGVPWQLHVGRLCGVTLLFMAALLAFLKFFRDEVLVLRLWWPWRWGHVVICGLGEMGLRLALDGRTRRPRKFVVAIEKHCDAAALEAARKQGILVFAGDACDISQLRKARVHRAEFVVAACREDGMNVAVASLAGMLVKSGQRRRAWVWTRPLLALKDIALKKQSRAALVCRLLLNDSELRILLNDQSVFPKAGSDYRINCDLQEEGTAARQALKDHYLDSSTIGKEDGTTVHLVVIGFSAMGQSLALHAARIGHFANEAEKGVRLRITAVDDLISARWPEFLKRAHNLDKVCDAAPSSVGRHDISFWDEMVKLSFKDGVLLTYALCLENDGHNLRAGLDLVKKVSSRAQVLIHQKSRCGFASIFPKEGRGEGLAKRRIHAFGMAEDIYAWDILLRESDDAIASALHAYYQLGAASASVHPDWAGLAENYKDSNRQAADHIPVKLRAIRCHIEPLQPGRERVEHFTDDERLLMAQMEHVRWCAERWLDDWKPGPETVREQKINHCLVAWRELKEKDRTKDLGQIDAIPQILRHRGLGVYRG